MIRALVVVSFLSSCISYRVHESDRTTAGYALALGGDAALATACTVGGVYGEDDDEGDEKWPAWKIALGCAAGTAAIDTAVMLLIFVGRAIVGADNKEDGI